MSERNYQRLEVINLENLPWSEYDEIQKEAKEAAEIVSTARGIINDAKTRYKKKKLNARNKKQAEDMKLRFAELDDYNSETDILDAYGWDFISEKEYDHLIELWHLREQYTDAAGKYSDPVIDVLQVAINCAFEPYEALISVANRMKDYKEQKDKEKLQADIAYQREKYLKEL